MNSVRAAAPQLVGMIPYDPKYLPAQAFLSANENPTDVPDEVRRSIDKAIRELDLNRYPDPLAHKLRAQIAEANGLNEDQVLLGNGGDELLFDIALAWGGPGRTLLNLPPTFSVYETNARLTNTTVANIYRDDKYAIDEAAVLDRVSQGDIDYIIVTSPNNPTGSLANEVFIEQLLKATDALVVVDEAYFEFSRRTIRPLMAAHKNLLILRTFSKAFSLAGVRMGYVLASREVIQELIKVRQPYSVDVLSQTVASVVFEQRAKFEPGIKMLISERERLSEELAKRSGVTVYPSDANYILFKVQNAGAIWESLYADGILIRDFSSAPRLEDCLRVSIGTPEQNDAFLAALDSALGALRD